MKMLTFYPLTNFKPCRIKVKGQWKLTDTIFYKEICSPMEHLSTQCSILPITGWP